MLGWLGASHRHSGAQELRVGELVHFHFLKGCKKGAGKDLFLRPQRGQTNWLARCGPRTRRKTTCLSQKETIFIFHFVGLPLGPPFDRFIEAHWGTIRKKSCLPRTNCLAHCRVHCFPQNPAPGKKHCFADQSFRALNQSSAKSHFGTQD